MATINVSSVITRVDSNFAGVYRGVIGGGYLWLAGRNKICKVSLSDLTISASSNVAGMQGVDVEVMSNCIVATDMQAITTFNTNMEQLSSMLNNGVYTVSKITDNTAIVGNYTNSKIEIYSFATPSSPSLLGSLQNANLAGCHDIIVDGNLAFVSGYLANKVCIINISNPSNPFLITTISIPYPHTLLKVNNYLYCCGYGYSGIVRKYDVSNLDNITQLAQKSVAYPSDIMLLDDGKLLLMQYDDKHLYVLDSNLRTENTLETAYDYRKAYSSSGGWIYLLGYVDGVVAKCATESIGADIYVGDTIFCDTSISATMAVSTTTRLTLAIECDTIALANVGIEGDIQDEAYKASNYPIIKVCIKDTNGSDVDISKYVIDIGTLIWQLEQNYRMNTHLTSNCSMRVYNKDGMFNQGGSFWTDAGYNSYRNVPVRIYGGFIIDGESIDVNMFNGIIVDACQDVIDDTITLDIADVSAMLSERLCSDTGDVYVGAIGGGDAWTEVYGDVTEYDEFIPINGGTYPTGFNNQGLIRIGDEIVYYSYLADNGFGGCERGFMGTSASVHADGDNIYPLLNNGEFCEGKYFQMPIYPILNVKRITTNIGDVTLVQSTSEFMSIDEPERAKYAYVDLETGIVEFGAVVSSVSVEAEYTFAPANVSWTNLARSLVRGAGLTDTGIEEIRMSDPYNNKVLQTLGRVFTTKDGDRVVSMPNLRCRAIAVQGDVVFLGIGGCLVEFSEGEFKLLHAEIGKEIVQLECDNTGVYGVIREQDINSLGQVFKYDISDKSYTLLTNPVALYTDFYSSIYGAGAWMRHGASWKGFSVDGSYVWFLYKSGSNLGVAKVPKSGGTVTPYIINTHYEPSSDSYKGFDFVDTGDYLEVLYLSASNPKEIRYSRLNKSSGNLSYVGVVSSCELNARFVCISDMVYHPVDNRIFYNEIYIYDEPSSTFVRGWFKALLVNTTSSINMHRYEWRYNVYYTFQGKFSGGAYYNGNVYYIKGTEASIRDNGDFADGYLYKFNHANSVKSIRVGHNYELNGKTYTTLGISSKIRFNAKGDMYVITADGDVSKSIDKSYSLTIYSSNIIPVMSVAKIADSSIWDVLSEIAILSGYKLGVDTNGVFLKEIIPVYSYLDADIAETSTSIVLKDASRFDDSGYVQIDVEIMYYAGKSNNTLTGCIRGCYDTVPVVHGKGSRIYGIDRVLINTQLYKAIKSARVINNFSELYNYIIVPFGKYKAYYDYKRAGEEWEGSSEKLYGRKELIVTNSLLGDNDGHIANIVAWRYYNMLKDMHSILEVETRYNPVLELGNMLSVKTKHVDYVRSMLRRIEVDFKQFLCRIVGLVNPTILEKPSDYY